MIGSLILGDGIKILEVSIGWSCHVVPNKLEETVWILAISLPSVASSTKPGTWMPMGA